MNSIVDEFFKTYSETELRTVFVDGIPKEMLADKRTRWIQREREPQAAGLIGTRGSKC